MDRAEALQRWKSGVAQRVPPGWRAPAIVLILALGIGAVGPFNTFAMLPLPQRLLYWAALIFGNWLLWEGGLRAARRLPARFGRGGWRLGLAAGLACPAGSLAVLLLHRALGFWLPPGGFWGGWLYFFLWYAAIALLVVAPLFLLARPRRDARPAEPPILKRLPPELRGPLLGLSAEDHYVRIFTARGDGLALMRFGDALAEVGPAKGSRVHRSHWVAAGAVAGVRASGHAMTLVLKDGRAVPVSRRYQREARVLAGPGSTAGQG